LHSLKGYLEINKKLSIKNKTTTTIKNPKRQQYNLLLVAQVRTINLYKKITTDRNNKKQLNKTIKNNIKQLKSELKCY
jgi:hypothetical protein